MQLAIFWLPLVAGLLLGGFAVAAWYGGDKTFAIWVGFVGVCLLVLTAALQVQQSVWLKQGQPHLTLGLSDQNWFLRWDPTISFQMQINNQLSPPVGAWKVPTFKILNSAGFAQDGSVKWAVTPYETKAVIDSSARLKPYQVTVDADQITLSKVNLGGQAVPLPFTHPWEWSSTTPLPFITRDVETFIPLGVWDTAALFFIANLSDEPAARSGPFYFDAEVNWKIPEEGTPQHFRLRATAVNARPAGVDTPAFLAKIEFEFVDER